MNSMGLVGQVPYSGDGPSPYLTVSGDTYATGQTGTTNQCTCQNMSGFLNSLMGDAGEGSPLGNTFGSAPIAPFGTAPIEPFGSAPVEPFGSAPVDPFGSAPVDPFGSAPVEAFCSNTIDPAVSNTIDPASGEGVTPFGECTDPTTFNDITCPTPLTVTQPTLFTNITCPTPLTVTQPTLFEPCDLPSMFQDVGSTNTAFNAAFSGTIGSFFS